MERLGGGPVSTVGLREDRPARARKIAGAAFGGIVISAFFIATMIGMLLGRFGPLASWLFGAGIVTATSLAALIWIGETWVAVPVLIAAYNAGLLAGAFLRYRGHVTA